jgi:peptidoglycan/LPS O-acetylase OafA/YrhL
MNRNFSIYLDLIRFLAAIVVLLHHFSDILFNSPYRIFNIGHEAVVVFFILSGYVIAYTIKAKKCTQESYFIARFSRIYSVAIPATILAISLDLIGTSIARESYQDIYLALDYPLIRFITSMTFTGELWFFSILSFSNIPYWSIHYEMFFYVFFGVLVFCPKRYKVPLLLTISLIAGPKILIMLPIWLFGVYLFRRSDINLSSKVLLLLWLLTCVVLFYLIAFDAKNIITKLANGFITGIWPQYKSLNMGGSKYFIFDYIFGIMFGAHLMATKQLCQKINLDFSLLPIGQVIRFLANRTFAIYLFHFPLLGFLNAIIPQFENNILRWSIIMILTLAFIFLLSHFTEQKKHIYANAIRFLISKVKNKYA